MLTPLRCSRTKPHRCGHAWFTDAAGKYPVCPKCRTSVSRTNTLRLVWPGEERPEGLHGWISVDVTRYHREPILVLNVASDAVVGGETVRLVEATLVDPRRFGLRALDLMDAINEAGGNVTVEGQYPVNGTIARAIAPAPDPAATMAEHLLEIEATLERDDEAVPDIGDLVAGCAIEDGDTGDDETDDPAGDADAIRAGEMDAET